MAGIAAFTEPGKMLAGREKVGAGEGTSQGLKEAA